MITDAMLEQDLERQPRKFTLHCTLFLFSLLALFLTYHWVRARIQQSRTKESKYDIMVKRQILESSAFKNCLQHYESNICVQYGSEEEYMAMMKLKEQ